MTISLVAVFIPVLFMGGIVGRLLHEFSVTIVVAILISGFVSLTLTPMLGSRFLKSDHGRRHGVLYNALEGGFNGLTRGYERTLGRALRFHPRHVSGRGRDAGGHRLPVQDHAHRLHPQPGQRLLLRRHAGPPGHFVRIHGAASEGRRRHASRRDPERHRCRRVSCRMAIRASSSPR